VQSKLVGTFKKISRLLLSFPRKVRILLGLIVLGLILLSFPLSEEPSRALSRVLLDNKGQLLRVWLNESMQFRFPPGSPLDDKYRRSVIEFEDRRFRWHWGVDPIALLRALRQNLQSGHVKSGASTVTMQVARLRNPQARTLVAKGMEAWNALRMEWQWGKDRIFSEYASLVPMGGNVVGVEAACWRFFGHSPNHMTWAEASLLAVLPNQPTALNLVRQRPGLLLKRNRLLARLASQGRLDSLSLKQAQTEPLPEGLGAFRFRAPHYAEQVARLAPQGIVRGTLDGNMQDLAERRAQEQLQRLSSLGVHNVAVLVMETATGNVRAYVGSEDWNDTLQAGRNDGVAAARSTGSLLKPFLYGLALQRGPWTVHSLLEDVPTWYGAFSPLNADQSYSGLVTMQDALARSLNVPAIRMLSEYGLQDFYWWLKGAGLEHLFRAPDRYGLPLVIGGAEASLLEMVPLYAMLARQGSRPSIRLWDGASTDSFNILSPGAAWQTAQMLTEVKRPDIDEYYQWLDNQVPVSWKTGTSFGARDAWAIGANAQWTIGIWVGNFVGGGIEGISGARSAAPLLFTLFNDLTVRSLPTWADPPNRHLRSVDICSFSGDLASDDCPKKEHLLVPSGARGMKVCAFHHRIVTDRTKRFVVCSRCWNPEDTAWTVELVLPPQAREIMQQKGSEVSQVYSHNPACHALQDGFRFALIYPDEGARIFIPRDFDGKFQRMVAEASHQDAHARLHWFLDGQPLGSTQGQHRMALNLAEGPHILVVQDASAAYRKVKFHVARKP